MGILSNISRSIREGQIQAERNAENSRKFKEAIDKRREECRRGLDQAERDGYDPAEIARRRRFL